MATTLNQRFLSPIKNHMSSAQQPKVIEETDDSERQQQQLQYKVDFDEQSQFSRDEDEFSDSQPDDDESDEDDVELIECLNQLDEHHYVRPVRHVDPLFNLDFECLPSLIQGTLTTNYGHDRQIGAWESEESKQRFLEAISNYNLLSQIGEFEDDGRIRVKLVADLADANAGELLIDYVSIQMRYPEYPFFEYIDDFCRTAKTFAEMKFSDMFKLVDDEQPKIEYNDLAYNEIEQDFSLNTRKILRTLAKFVPFDVDADFVNYNWVSEYFGWLEETNLFGVDEKDVDIVRVLVHIIQSTENVLCELQKRAMFALKYAIRTNLASAVLAKREKLVQETVYPQIEDHQNFYFDFVVPQTSELGDDLQSDDSTGCSVRFGVSPSDGIPKYRLKATRIVKLEPNDYKLLFSDDSERISSVFELQFLDGFVDCLTVIIACEAFAVAGAQKPLVDGSKIFLRVLKDQKVFGGDKSDPVGDGEAQGERESFHDFNFTENEQILDFCKFEDIPVREISFQDGIPCDRKNVRYYAANVRFVLSCVQCVLVKTFPLTDLRIDSSLEKVGSSIIPLNCKRAMTDDESVKILISPDILEVSSTTSSIYSMKLNEEWFPRAKLTLLNGSQQMDSLRKLGFSYDRCNLDLVLKVEIDWDSVRDRNPQVREISIKNLIEEEINIHGSAAVLGEIVALEEVEQFLDSLDDLFNEDSMTRTPVNNSTHIEKLVYGITNNYRTSNRLDFSSMQISPSKSANFQNVFLFALKNNELERVLVPNQRFPRLQWLDLTEEAKIRICDGAITFEIDEQYSEYLLFRREPNTRRYQILNSNSELWNDPIYNGLCSNVYHYMRVARKFDFALFQQVKTHEFHLVFCSPHNFEHVLKRFDDGFKKIGETQQFIGCVSTSILVRVSDGLKITKANVSIGKDQKTIQADIESEFVNLISFCVDFQWKTGKDNKRDGAISVMLEGRCLFPEDLENMVQSQVKTRREINGRKSEKNENSSIDPKSPIYPDLSGDKQIGEFTITVLVKSDSGKCLVVEKYSTFAKVILQDNPHFPGEFKLLDEIAMLIAVPSRFNSSVKPMAPLTLCRHLELPDGIHDFFKRSLDKSVNSPDFFKPKLSENRETQFNFMLLRCIMRLWFLTTAFMAEESPFCKLGRALLRERRTDAVLQIREHFTERCEKQENFTIHDEIDDNVADDLEKQDPDWWNDTAETARESDFNGPVNDSYEKEENILEKEAGDREKLTDSEETQQNEGSLKSLLEEMAAIGKNWV